MSERGGELSKLATHGTNHKKGGIGGLARHNERMGDNHDNPDIDPTRTKDNFYLKKPTVSLYQDCKAEVERVKANGGRLRSDQNWLAEFTVYAPQEPLARKKEYERYFNAVYSFFAEKVGHENIKSAVVHMDEKTPHLHLDFMPLIRNENGEPVKLSSKEVMTRKFLFSIQDELPKRLQEQGFNVQRGDKVKLEDKHLKGRSTKKYKADMERERLELEKQIESLKVQHEYFQEKIKEDYSIMDRNWGQIQAIESDLAEICGSIDALETYLGKIVNELKKFDNLDKIIDKAEEKLRANLRKQVHDKKLEYGLAAKNVNAELNQTKKSYGSIVERLEKAKAAAAIQNAQNGLKKPQKNNRDGR